VIPELLAAASLTIWLYLFLGRGRFWLLRDAPTKPCLPATPPAIVAVIPARNEVESVGSAIGSLAAQAYTGEFHIVLVDDGSSDGTAEAARAAATSALLTVIDAGEPPPGWTGKLWAVAQGVSAAARRRPEFLLLTDADIAHAPGSLAGLVARAESGGYDIASYMATLACESLAERALTPAFVFFFFMLYPPNWIRDPGRATAGAAGGCLLVRREALERIGGIAAIRGELIDDCALAAAIKRTGGRVWLGTSAATRSLRRYGSFAEIGRMIARSAFTQLRHSTALLAGTMAGMALVYVAPPALALAFPGSLAGGLGALAWLLMCACYLPALRYYRRSLLWAPLLPLTALFYMGATMRSAMDYWRGEGGRWKGRAQDRRAKA